MADASRVGYRTNGLSSALQLHHPSSRVGQTDGIALPGVHQRRMPMDHAIADSHATVTISHSGEQESQDPPIACNAEIPPKRGQKEPPPGSLSYFDTRRCVRGKARVSAIRHAWWLLDAKARIGTYVPPVAPRRQLHGVKLGSRVDSSPWFGLHGKPLLAGLTRHKYGCGVESVQPDRSGSARRVLESDRRGRPQFAERRSRTARQRSTSRPYASPAAAPSPSRRASMPSATSAAEWSPSSSAAGRTCTRPP